MRVRVVQTGGDSMVVKIVKGKTYSEGAPERIYHVLKDAVGDEVEMRFEFADNIPHARLDIADWINQWQKNLFWKRVQTIIKRGGRK